VRIALDTNVLVSAVATRGLCADVLQLVLAEHQLILGSTVLKELRRVLRTKLRVPATTVDEVDAFLRRQAVVVTAQPPVQLEIRDQSDRVVLAEAVAGRADVLVTGDRDLLDVADHAPVPILTPRGIWERLRSAR
jgi:putative PIN family toxin of toxin-antitoxin system